MAHVCSMGDCILEAGLERYLPALSNWWHDSKPAARAASLLPSATLHAPHAACPTPPPLPHPRCRPLLPSPPLLQPILPAALLAASLAGCLALFRGLSGR